MLRNFTFTVIFALYLLFSFSLETQAGQLQVGDYAPLFSAKTLEGENFSLLRHRGKTVLLSFWTTWCYKCRDEMIFLQEISQDLSDSIVIIGISEETEFFGVHDILRIENFMTKQGVDFPTVLDEGKKVWDAYGLRTLPTSVIIDLNGRIQLLETYFFAESEENIKFLLQLLSNTGQESNPAENASNSGE